MLLIIENPKGFKDDATYGNDTANDYTYDANGNMTVDQNKGITAIVYNHLNLPTKITFGTTGTIDYLYDTAGIKLQKKVTQGTTVTTTDYLGGYQYTNQVLDFFPTAEGYVKHTLVSGVSYFNYVFNHTDHLGNVRLSYTKDPATGVTKIIEENHNYPFGLKHTYNATDYEFSVSGSSVILSQVTENKFNYQYQGQERQDELGLGWDSFKYRNYDYAIGRFMSIDPLAEKYPYNSTYAFQENKMGLGRELEGLELHVGTGYGMMKIAGKVINWVKDNVYIGPDNGSSRSGGSKETAPGSGITISGKTPFTGDSGRMKAGHPEDNVEIPYEIIEQLGSWRDMPGTEPINGMTEAIKKTDNIISNVKETVELFDEGMDAGENVMKPLETISSNNDLNNQSVGLEVYYYDKTLQMYYGVFNLSQDEYNKIIDRKDIIINPPSNLNVNYDNIKVMPK